MAYRIPRDSLVEANQSGLIAETLIDITPKLPILPSKVQTKRTPACITLRLSLGLPRGSTHIH